MKTRLNYTAWKITVQEAYCPASAGTGNNTRLHIPPAGQESQAAAIYHEIRKWRRFPVSFGDPGGPDEACIFVLLDRLKTPLALINPMYTTIAKAEKVRPSELPKALRQLYNHLVQLGHAAPETELANADATP